MFPTYNPFLVVKESLVHSAGLGLFTTVAIPRGSFIDVYHGTVFTDKELEEYEAKLTGQEQDKMRAYLLFDRENHLNIVPFHTTDCYSRFANDVTLQGRMCNAIFSRFRPRNRKTRSYYAHFPSVDLPVEHRRATMCIRASVDILPGEEIYVDYGSDYWRQPLPKEIIIRKRKYTAVVQRIKKEFTARKTRKLYARRNRNLVYAWPAENDTKTKQKRIRMVVAKWSKSCKNRLGIHEGGILDFDPSTKKWLILSNTVLDSAPDTLRTCYKKIPLPLL